MKEFSLASDKVLAELDLAKANVEAKYSNDEIKDKIANIFQGKVGHGFAGEDLRAKFEEGAKRYEECIPPGYKDAPKAPANANEADLRRRYCVS